MFVTYTIDELKIKTKQNRGNRDNTRIRVVFSPVFEPDNGIIMDSE